MPWQIHRFLLPTCARSVRRISSTLNNIVVFVVPWAVVLMCLTGFLSFPLSLIALALGLCILTCVRALALSAALKHMQQLHGDTPPISLADLQLTLVERDFTALDYEALLALDESTPVHPVSDTQLATLPVQLVGSSIQKPTAPCCVCLEGYAPGARVVTLPACGHTFHAQCATAWVQCRGTGVRCPLCNVSIFVSPQSVQGQHQE